MPRGAQKVRDEERLELLASVPIQAANGRPPEWVNIIPIADGEGRIQARDGRAFILDDPAAFVAASNAAVRKTGPQPVDKDHEMYSWWGGGGPALGWAEQYELRPDGVYAKTDWLADGAELITSKRYRYTSSVIRCEMTNVERDKWGFVDSFDLRMLQLEGFTITNIPALEVTAMFSAQPPTQRTRMDITALLALVGLPATATREEFYDAAKTRLAAAEPPSPDKFVPRADHDDLKANLARAEALLAKQSADAASAEREQLLGQALTAGQVLPATADFYRQSMLAEGGVERFKEYLKTAPKLGGPATIARATTEASTTTLTDQELAACQQCGITPEQFLKARAERQKSTT